MALRIANDVIANDRTGPRAAAVFHLGRARALAQRGDLNGALNDPDWTWVDEAELAGHRARSLASADDWPNALDLFQAAYEQRAEAAPRSRFNDRANLLAAQVSVRTWHDAEASLNDLAVDLASVRSGRTTALLRQINAEQTASPASILDSGERLAVLLDDPG